MYVQAYILDGLDRQVEITSFRSIKAVEHDLATGAWAVVLNGNDLTSNSVAQAVVEATYLGLELFDNDSGWRFAGPATYLSRTYGSGGVVSTIEIRGVDYMYHLDSLLLWPSTDLDDWHSNPAQVKQLSAHLIDTIRSQGGPTVAYTPRQIPDLKVEPPVTPFGDSQSYQQNRIPLSEGFHPLFESTGYTYRLRLVRTTTDNRLVFTTNERTIADVIVSPGMGSEITITETAAAATWVVAMGEQIDGQPDGVRHVVSVQGEEYDWRTLRRERFVNRPSTDVASLATEAQLELSDAGPVRTVTVPDFELDQFGLIADIGDFVTVHYDDGGGSVLVPIQSSTLTGTPEGWYRTVSIGKEIPVGPRQMAARYNTMSRRIRRLESQV